MRRGTDSSKLIAQLMALGVVALIVSLIVWDCRRMDDVRAARDWFFEPLHAGDLDTAYARLSRERRAVMSREEFEMFINHPVFLDSNATYYPPEQDAPGWCISGYVERPEGKWLIQVFLLEEDDELRMHSIAAQRPARVGLASLVAPCGFWKGTLVGYNGPLPEPTTKTTRDRW